ncbi:hypothetical protein [Segetibacter aerophilus]|uniref:POTRA domain-containing protein n=1 Tax=Segetibacter aerophilus TaxID=670293 RepID=A0A512B8P6_9BACT|nr:hypothetical protein [Segetibacter aerophilus]GEO08334.1 hypothetical protein SAE01_08300 [Segetibacter aerophilus]
MDKKSTHTILVVCFVLLTVQSVQAQETKNLPRKKSTFFNRIFNRVKSSVTVSPPDTTQKAPVTNAKSVVPFIEYQGKVIRSVITQELGFERLISDTTNFINHYGSRILNALHTNTYDWVIRHNLFIKKGSKLNPYLLSDNERYLRSLEFIQDARVVVKPVKGTTDSVDVFVITKDLFSITGSLNFSGVDRQRVTAGESNLAGAGQKVQITALHDVNRSPKFGYDFMYSKNSILHSFITGTLGYSRINNDRTGRDNVSSFYLQLSRPLVSPYSHFAGGLDLRFNQSYNLYNIPDSLFYNYKNASIDIWTGYSIGLKRLLKNNNSRNRTFIAARYIKNEFGQKPFQIGESFNNLFNNQRAFLGEITFFKQEFYKTNYIYGFGTTEDVPYGYNIALTAGWYKQLELSRPYFGINANKYIATEKGKFMQIFIRSGFFLNRGMFEDASILAGGSLYSRLYLFSHFKMRQYLKYSYTRLYNRVVYDPLRIDNSLGLKYFNADSVRGSQRMSLYAETFFFAKYKLLGFQLAPFVFGDASLLTGQNGHFLKSDLYTGVGAGIRARNVNLIFSTAELRAIYFPRKAQDMQAFQISFYGDIRFRYNTNYIRPPDIIQLNNEDSNSFY